MKTILESFKYTDFIDSLDPTLKLAVYELGDLWNPIGIDWSRNF